MSPVATLVERKTRFLMLIGLPRGDHQADAVAHALTTAITTCPVNLQSADLGSGPRDGPASAVHRSDRSAGLFLRSEVAVATRQQREHQRPAAPVPAPTPRLPDTPASLEVEDFHSRADGCAHYAVGSVAAQDVGGQCGLVLAGEPVGEVHPGAALPVLCDFGYLDVAAGAEAVSMTQWAEVVRAAETVTLAEVSARADFPALVG